ncbi:hypothetical protein C0992_013038 [Termitomyces sp. T32_za158]|nr:hypothetical protein C0992_013038 [Termitomyces sp. T32_za158]
MRKYHPEEAQLGISGTSPPVNLGGKAWEYNFIVPNSEVKLKLLREEEKIWGKPQSVGSATARKLEYLLESMQPYPGDLENCLQYKGHRFVAYDINDLEMTLWDQVRSTDFIVSIDYLSREDYEVGLWYAEHCAAVSGSPIFQEERYQTILLWDTWAWNASRVLELGAPYTELRNEATSGIGNRFRIYIRRREGTVFYKINDVALNLKVEAEYGCLHDPMFDLVGWYQARVKQLISKVNKEPPEDPQYRSTESNKTIYLRPLSELDDDLIDLRQTIQAMRNLEMEEEDEVLGMLELNGQQIEQGTYPNLIRNNICRKREQRHILKPLVIVIKINGHPVHALIDSGSLGDFMSGTVAEQLKVEKHELAKPIGVQLAV